MAVVIMLIVHGGDTDDGDCDSNDDDNNGGNDGGGATDDTGCDGGGDGSDDGGNVYNGDDDVDHDDGDDGKNVKNTFQAKNRLKTITITVKIKTIITMWWWQNKPFGAYLYWAPESHKYKSSLLITRSVSSLGLGKEK